MEAQGREREIFFLGEIPFVLTHIATQVVVWEWAIDISISRSICVSISLFIYVFFYFLSDLFSYLSLCQAEQPREEV